MIGGVLFGVGHLVAALALHWKSLTLLYLGYRRDWAASAFGWDT